MSIAAQDGWHSDRRGWNVLRDGDVFALSRRLPVRWDVEAATDLPDLGRRRLAHAVRQDMWRAFRQVRGFAPVVEVTRTKAGCAVRAGGAVAGQVPETMASRIAGMLADPDQRAKWIKAARHREDAL